jgi:GNAT superfamily N-acetyltransferase
MSRVRNPPPGYPAAYETYLSLDDGARVWVRPILPSDRPELARAIRSADPADLRNRFMGGAPPTSRAALVRLTVLDYRDRFALVARAGGRGIAVARYSRLEEPDEDGAVTAELAVAISASWRHLGLATGLIHLLAQRALECGIASFTAEFLSRNQQVVELANRARVAIVVANSESSLHARLDPTAPPTD